MNFITPNVFYDINAAYLIKINKPVQEPVNKAPSGNIDWASPENSVSHEELPAEFTCANALQEAQANVPTLKVRRVALLISVLFAAVIGGLILAGLIESPFIAAGAIAIGIAYYCYKSVRNVYDVAIDHLAKHLVTWTHSNYGLEGLSKEERSKADTFKKYVSKVINHTEAILNGNAAFNLVSQEFQDSLKKLI